MNFVASAPMFLIPLIGFGVAIAIDVADYVEWRWKVLAGLKERER